MPSAGNAATRSYRVWAICTIDLGFNNSVFLLHAMLESLVGRPYTAHVVNGFISALGCRSSLADFRMIFRPSADERQLGWFTLAMAMIVSISHSIIELARLRRVFRPPCS